MIGALSASKSLAGKLFIRRIQMVKKMIVAVFVCLAVMPSSAFPAGSFGGLVVPNMGQVKNGEGVLYYMDAPWGRLYVTEQGLLFNVIQDVEQAPSPAMSSSTSQPWAAVQHDSGIGVGRVPDPANPAASERRPTATPFATDPFLTPPFANGGVVPLLSKEGLGEIYSEVEGGFTPAAQIPPTPFSKGREGPMRGKFDHAAKSGDRLSFQSGTVPLFAGEKGTVPGQSPFFAVRRTGILLTLPGACWREVIPEDPQVTKLNFFYGNDPKGWVTDVPTYGRLRIKNVFPGTDLVLEPKSPTFWRTEGLRHDLIDNMREPSNGRLDAIGITLKVPGSFMEQNSVQHSEHGSLRVSQTLIWSTFLGGSFYDAIWAMELDNRGNIIVAGSTGSLDFPVQNGYDLEYNGGGSDIFVAALSGDGRNLLWATYMGGKHEDRAWGMALDAGMNIVLCGDTNSDDMPTTEGAFDTSYNDTYDGEDIYVAKISADGKQLMWGAYIGGHNLDYASDCIVNQAGNVILIGASESPDIALPGGFDTQWKNIYGDIYIAKISGDGSMLEWATFLGGSSWETANSIALDAEENVIIAGTAQSADIPVPGGYDTIYNHGDIYVAKVSIAENRVVWGTFIGGGESDGCNSMALDADGNINILGGTYSPDMPVPNGYCQTYSGDADMYAAKLSANGKSLLWGSYLGGIWDDWTGTCAININDNMIIAGWTTSPDMPVPNGYDTQPDEWSNNEMYIAELSSSGRELLWGTYLGGTHSEFVHAVLCDSMGNVIVAGSTRSPDFPVLDGYDINALVPDAVITKLSDPSNVGPSLYVAVSARAAGANGTSWRTDTMVANPADGAVCYDLYYLPGSGSAAPSGICETRCLNGGESFFYHDILGSACGIYDESAGSLRVEPTGGLLMTTRTYNETEDGTYGQFIKSVDRGQGLGKWAISLGSNRTRTSAPTWASLKSPATKLKFPSGFLIPPAPSYWLPATSYRLPGGCKLGYPKWE
jgi:hypothetical protein